MNNETNFIKEKSQMKNELLQQTNGLNNISFGNSGKKNNHILEEDSKQTKEPIQITNTEIIKKKEDSTNGNILGEEKLLEEKALKENPLIMKQPSGKCSKTFALDSPPSDISIIPRYYPNGIYQKNISYFEASHFNKKVLEELVSQSEKYPNEFDDEIYKIYPSHKQLINEKECIFFRVCERCGVPDLIETNEFYKNESIQVTKNDSIEKKSPHNLHFPIESETKKDSERKRSLRVMLNSLFEWMKLSYKGMGKNDSQLLSKKEAAKKVGIPKKTLDDYLMCLKKAIYLNFPFETGINKGLGQMRKFLKEKAVILDKKHMKSECKNVKITPEFFEKHLK